MTQAERLSFLIKYLISEDNGLTSFHIPVEENERKRLLRSLMNIRPPKPVTKEFLDIQDEYLQEEKIEKGIISLADIPSMESGIYLWQGDITRLSVDAIVNAANSAMLGCFVPCHGCIDNAIHSAAGIQLRNECARLMEEQGHEEPAGKAKITWGDNLPAKHVIHTVGPVVGVDVTEQQKEQLRSCYLSSMILAERERLRSVAFCCISTGEFHFPNETAAQIAIQTVKDYQKKNPSDMEVIFNVFKDCDYKIYKQLLG